MSMRAPCWSGVLFSFLVVLAGCGTQPVRPGGTYTVKAGDTLYSIAWRHGVDFHELARLNRIGSDYRIYPGQVLKLSSAARTPSNTSQQARSTKTNALPAPSTTTPALAPRFVSPTQGSYAPTVRPNGGIGLLYNGRAGQEIRAAAAGRVVYSGNGLLGYGQLLIIKHNEQYLSAYGHLQLVNVKEGEAVTSDQSIATMGNGPDGTPQLYFEIRVDGRPVEPSALLQAR